MERRLAAILAADVVGYIRLMGQDEAGTHKAGVVRQNAAYPAPETWFAPTPNLWSKFGQIGSIEI